RDPRQVVAPLRLLLQVEPGEGRLQARALAGLALLDHLGHPVEHGLVVTGVAAHGPGQAALERGLEAGDLAAVLLIAGEGPRLLLGQGRLESGPSEPTPQGEQEPRGQGQPPARSPGGDERGTAALGQRPGPQLLAQAFQAGQLLAARPAGSQMLLDPAAGRGIGLPVEDVQSVVTKAVALHHLSSFTAWEPEGGPSREGPLAPGATGAGPGRGRGVSSRWRS